MKQKKWTNHFAAKSPAGTLAVGMREKCIQYLNLFEIEHLLLLYENRFPAALLNNLAGQLQAQGVNVVALSAGSDLNSLHTECLERLYSGRQEPKTAVIASGFEALPEETRNELLTLATISRGKGIGFIISGEISKNTQAAAAIAVYAPFGVLICEQGGALTYMWGAESTKMTRFLFAGKRRVKNGT